MNTYRMTVDRIDGTWGQLEFEAPDAAQAMRHAARSYDLGGVRAVHIVRKEE